MLAQNFMAPADLKVSEKELDALIQVLGMLERGELEHDDSRDGVQFTPKTKFGFNMTCSGASTDCGTVACIGGWVAMLMGKTGDAVNDYVNFKDSSSPVGRLYWGNTHPSVTTDQAAAALRSFITTGKPNWSEVS